MLGHLGSLSGYFLNISLLSNLCDIIRSCAVTQEERHSVFNDVNPLGSWVEYHRCGGCAAIDRTAGQPFYARPWQNNDISKVYAKGKMVPLSTTFTNSLPLSTRVCIFVLQSTRSWSFHIQQNQDNKESKSDIRPVVVPAPNEAPIPKR